MPLDRDKLGKVPAMTTSSHDREVLVAVRLAGRMLKESGIACPQLFCRWWRIILEERTTTTVVLYTVPDESEFSTPGERPRWVLVATRNKDVAACIVARLANRDFAQRLFEFACRVEHLPEKQLTALRRDL